MATRRAGPRERPLVAICAATALHVTLVGFSARLCVPSAPLATQVTQPIEIDVEPGSWRMPTDPAPAASKTDEGPGASHRFSPSPRAPSTRATIEPPPAALAGEPPSAEPVSGDGDGPPAAGTASGGSVAPARGIDIWRSGAADRIAMLDALGQDTPPADEPSVGLLREGLAERDALAGVSRSGAAIPAGHESAQLYAPSTGTAVFELQTDATGFVRAVRLLSSGSDDERWERVREALAARLANHRLRVPPGSKGMVTRLRIERGELAVDLSERHRTERKAALGQAPLHRREEWDESTRASLEPGRLSPSLGVAVSGVGKAHPTRVVILSERYL